MTMSGPNNFSKNVSSQSSYLIQNIMMMNVILFLIFSLLLQVQLVTTFLRTIRQYLKCENCFYCVDKSVIVANKVSDLIYYDECDFVYLFFHYCCK